MSTKLVACLLLLRVNFAASTTFVRSGSTVSFTAAKQYCSDNGYLLLELCDATVADEFWTWIASMNNE